MSLNLSEWFLCYTFTHCNPLSKGTIDFFLEEEKFDFFYSSWKYLIFVFCFRLSIYTSKISYLLLSLGAEGSGGRESWYTQQMIYPINTSMMLKVGKS